MAAAAVNGAAATVQYPLFGGAITVQLPDGLVDASDLRQVADTQEVFLSPHSDVSYIFDITESVEPVGLKEATEFHFESLAHDNDASSSQILSLVPSTIEKQPSICHGRQTVAKYRRSAEEADLVDILLALWRIPEKNADLVFSMNIPRGRADEISREVLQQPLNPWQAHFETAASTLNIVDYHLFGG